MAQFAIPRRFAFVPLLIAACHFPNIQIISSFTIVRLVVLAGLLRAAAEIASLRAQRQSMDRWFVLWAVWAFLSSFAHQAKENYNPLTVHLSLIFDYAGTYLYARTYFRENLDLMRFSKCLAIVLMPLAGLLLVEHVTGKNLYSLVGAMPEPWVREGRIRAAGPFGNAILAGIVGGVSFPLMMLLLREDRRWALRGLAACLLIVFSSSSSTPFMTLFAGIGILSLWRWRSLLPRIRLGIIAMLIALALVMEAPIWYLIARIDIAGGSTSWHRAELIQQAVEHLGEWWLVGTDYTRHWMPYGIEWSEDHVDITNHYINMGVRGGLLLMLSFIVILFKAFQLLGRKMQALRMADDPTEFMFWCLGTSLFVHAFTFMAISYFDQSYVLVSLVLGAVPGLCSSEVQQVAESEATTVDASMNSAHQDEPVGRESILSPQEGALSRSSPPLER